MFSPTTSDIQDFLEMAKKELPDQFLLAACPQKNSSVFCFVKWEGLLTSKNLSFVLKIIQILREKPFQELGITHIIQEVPHLIQIEGERLNGTEFFQMQKYQHYTFEELEKAADINVPPRIIKKLLIRLLYISALIDMASQMTINKRESMIGC